MLVVYPINFNNLPSINFTLENLAGSVTSGQPGRTYLNTLTGTVEVWNGTTTLVLGAAVSTLGNTNSIAQRDGSGFLTAQKFIGPLNGNADTATVAANSILLGSQNSAFYLARGNHTGSITSSVISDLPANIQATRLDQLTAPQASVSLNNFNLILLADPVNPTDGVTKRYVDNSIATTESLFLTKAVYDPLSTGTVGYAQSASLLAGVSGSYYLNRGNHTGTQLSATISDLLPVIHSQPLSTLTAPTSNLSLAGYRITLLGTPGSASDAATKGYVDNSITAIPSPQWTSVLNVPPLRKTFQFSLPNTTDTSAGAQSEAEGYDSYFFYGVSGWRRVLSVPFRSWVTAPANSSATGTLGQTAYDSTYFYICTATNTWKRITLSTWSGSVPFVQTATVPINYTYSDGSYFYIATGINYWQRFALNTAFGPQAVNGVIPTQSYYPGLPGMETIDVTNSFWYYCCGQNLWARAFLSSF